MNNRVVFTSPSKLRRHLEEGGTHDVFVYDGPDREVVLRNDCRSYPLKVRAVFVESRATASIDAFARRCCETYSISFASSIPGAKTSRLPGVASKVGLFRPLDTVEVHFYKDAPRRDRRRIIQWLVHAQDA